MYISEKFDNYLGWCIFIAVIICWCEFSADPICLSNNGFAACICGGKGPRTALNSWYEGGGAIAREVSCLIILLCCSVSTSLFGTTRGFTTFEGDVDEGMSDECRLFTRINA